MRRWRVLWLLGLLLAARASADAASRYIAPTGSDNNPGTLAQPWKTIQKAADTLVPGDVAFARAGTYAPVNVHVSGSALGGFVTFCNYPGEKPVIDASGIAPPAGDAGLFLLVDRSYVVISGFELRNFATTDPTLTPAGIFLRGACQHIQILNCEIHHIANTGGDTLVPGNAFGFAIYGSETTPAADLLIDGNSLHDLQTGGSESLVVNGNVTGFQISNNSLHDNNNIGIDCVGFEGTCPDPTQDQARNGVCRANTIFNMTSEGNQAYDSGDFSADGIYCDGAANIVIERNIVHNCDIGIELASEHEDHLTSSIAVRDNFVYSNRQTGLFLGGFAQTGTGGTGDCTITGNTFFSDDTLDSGNGEAQLRYRTSACDLRDNILDSGTGNLLVSTIGAAADNTANTFDYNLYFSAAGASQATWSQDDAPLIGLGAWQNASGQDPHSLFADPLFVGINSTIDLHLQARSPAIEAGDPAFVPASGEIDIDGNPRVNGARVDIGADEIAPASPPMANAVLANLSTRLRVGTGDDVLIGGFIVTGSQPKKILLRARGPSLATAGVAGFAPDPSLSLVDSAGHVLAINNNWSDNQNAPDIIASGLAPTDPRESALLVTLAPGAYTAIVSPADGSTGIALVEVYDLDPNAGAKLANLSTRGLVQNNDEVLIGGIIVNNTAGEKIIVRARGPSLTGVASALADPMLELRDANGSLLAANDNWQDTDAAKISATNLAPTSPNEAAILTTLLPGSYTAIVSGKNHSTGQGLVEFYDLQ